MPPLTAAQRAAQTWMGTGTGTASFTPQQLCNVQLPEELARPWLLTVYAQTSGGVLIAPTNPLGPFNVGASPQPPVYAVPQLPAVLRVTIGRQVVTMDYPARGATYAVSPASQVNVALVSSFAGGVVPSPMPEYAARLTEAEGPGFQPHLATPRYTYAPGVLSVGQEWTGLVPVRAQSATLYHGDTVGAGTEQLMVQWLDDSGAVITSELATGGASGVFGGFELTQWPIPGRATQWRLRLAGVENLQPALVFNLAL